MKCHYVYDEEVGRVLIPGCWSVVISDDKDDCTCQTTTFSQFEKEKYNEVLKEKSRLIKELESENMRLNNIIQNLLKEKR